MCYIQQPCEVGLPLPTSEPGGDVGRIAERQIIFPAAQPIKARSMSSEKFTLNQVKTVIMESTLRELTQKVVQKYDIPDTLYLMMPPVKEPDKYK